MANFLFIGLIPVLISFLGRKFMSDGTVRREGGAEVSISGGEMVERILKKGRATEVEIQIKARPFRVLGPKKLVISSQLNESKKALDVAEAGLLAGLVLMARKQEKVVGWRIWAVKFGSAMPAFTMIVMAFALVVAKIGAIWCLGVLAATLGLATVFLWLTLPVELAAAGAVAEMLEETALVSRRSEGERLANLVKALAWRRIIPGAIAWIGGK